MRLITARPATPQNRKSHSMTPTTTSHKTPKLTVPYHNIASHCFTIIKQCEWQKSSIRNIWKNAKRPECKIPVKYGPNDLERPANPQASCKQSLQRNCRCSKRKDYAQASTMEAARRCSAPREFLASKAMRALRASLTEGSMLPKAKSFTAASISRNSESP